MAKAFNEMYDEFMVKLKAVASFEPGLWTLHDGFNLLKKANSRGPVEIWVSVISPHSKKIFEKDENYFLKNKRLEKRAAAFSEGEINTTEIISKMWNEKLTETARKAIWMYFQNLCILGFTYIGIENCAFDRDLLKRVLDHTERYLPENNGGVPFERNKVVEDLKSNFANTS